MTRLMVGMGMVTLYDIPASEVTIQSLLLAARPRLQTIIPQMGLMMVQIP